VAIGFDEAGMLEADASQFMENEFGGSAAIALVFGQGGDGRNAQQVLEFLQIAGVVLTSMGYGG
jgi:hypothetical protein